MSQLHKYTVQIAQNQSTLRNIFVMAESDNAARCKALDLCEQEKQKDTSFIVREVLKES